MNLLLDLFIVQYDPLNSRPLYSRKALICNGGLDPKYFCQIPPNLIKLGQFLCEFEGNLLSVSDRHFVFAKRMVNYQNIWSTIKPFQV